MKKFLILTFLVLAAVGAFLPWVNGMVMEKLARDSFSRLNEIAEKNGSGIRYDILEYHRGYDRSRALWKVELGPLARGEVTEVVFSETATHGWTKVTSQTRLQENDWYADWVNGPMKGEDPLAIRTRYAAFGPIVTRVTLAPFSLDLEGRSMNIGALDLTVSMDRTLSKGDLDGTWEGLSNDKESRLAQVAVQSRMEKVSGLIWQGRARLSVKALAIEDPKAPLAVSNLVLTTEMAADKAAGQMDVFVTAGAEDIALDGESLSRWSLGLGLKKMDMQALEEISRVYAEMTGRMAPLLSDPDISPEKRDRILGQLMLENRMALVSHFEKMLKKGFGLDVSPVDITLPQGRIQGHFYLSLLKDMTLAGFFPVAAQPELALEIFSLDSDLSLPGEFLRTQPNLTVPLFNGMKTGVFSLEGGRLHHRAQTREKRLYLNGEAVDLGG